MIFEIGGKLVSGELFEQKFVCDLTACRGACCVEGDAGAPLEQDELPVLEREIEAIKPFMRKEGVEVIEKDGVYVQDIDGDVVTPLINGNECAFVVFDENNIAKCAIEQAHQAGETTFKKPISCHLYPIRVSKLSSGDALNFHRWQICDAAHTCGAKLEVPVFRFLKDAIVRKYGQDFFEQLCIAHESSVSGDLN